jgi:uncharacterized lipoprotein YbaY
MASLAIRGVVRLPSPQLFDDAVAIVGLDDVSKIDAPSVRVAETVITSIRGLRDLIPFCLLSEERLPDSHSYVLTAEIRRSKGRALSPGDFLTTVAFSWTSSDRDDKIVDVSQI